jgi:hypothetical protein
MQSLKKPLKFCRKCSFFLAQQLHNTTKRKQKRKVKKMKNKLTTITAVLLSLIAFNFTFAQSTAGTSAPITVSIIRALTIQNVAGNLGFPEVIMNGTLQTVSKTNANGVRFLITGQPNRNVTVTYDLTDALNNNAWVTANGGTNGTMTFTTNTADQTGSSTTFTTPTVLASGTTLPLVNDNGTGKLNVWVGGSITVSATQPAGDYVGTFNISVHY